MKLQVQSYNNGAYNAEEEETKFRSYSLEHEFNGPARAIITLADTDGSILRKYNADIDPVGGAVADDGGAETDETAEANEDTADDMTLLPLNPVSGDAYYFGFASTFKGITLNISTAGVGTWGFIYEYSTGADAWTALSGVTDNTTQFQTAGANSIVWTIPGDWATDEVGGVANLYWMRCRLVLILHTSSPKGQQAWIGGTYLGPGKVTIEDPTGTDIFFGRIKKVIGDFTTRTVTLECVDWLDQLDEEQITYDMREKLGTTDMRQSMLRSDVDGGRVCVENDAGTYYAYDDGEYHVNGGMAFVNDAYNGMFLVFTTGMAGTKTWIFHPYDSTPAGEDSYDDNVWTVWADSGFTEACAANNDFTLTYHFHVELGHNTPSDFYIHDSIKSAKLISKTMITEVGSTNHAHIQIYDNDAAAPATLEHIVEQDVLRHRETPIPLDVVPYITDAGGEVDIIFDVDRTAGDATLSVAHLALEVEATTTGYSTAVTINDTINPNKLEIATDLTAAATQMWEGVPYCIARPQYQHIASDETPGGLITDGDGIVTLTCAGTIEHTSGISTRQYKDKTRLHILKDLATQDKASFWITLGGTTVTYKQTFGADTQQLTDGDILDWRSMYDYNQMTNEYHIYGARIGDYEIYQSQQNAASIAKYNATRTKIEKRAGVVSDYEAKALATALAARDAELLQMVTCTIVGNTATAAHATTIKLGEIVEITSSYLWPTAAKDYIVTRFAYDSTEHKTYLTLQPKSSIGLQEIDSVYKRGAVLVENVKENNADKYIPDPVSHEVS